jgi:beta-lactamase regulating signal transducer with metallopeptidase domain
MMSSPCLFVLPNESAQWIQLLLDMAIKGVLILLVAGVLVAMLKSTSAAARHLLWSVAVASLLVLPIFELVLPNWQVPVFPALLQNASAETAGNNISQNEQSSPDITFSSAYNENPNSVNPSASLKVPATAKHSARKTPDELPTLPPYKTPLFDDVQSEQNLATGSSSMNWAMMIFIIWSAGFLVVMARFAVGTFKVWMIARRAESLTDNYWAKLLHQLTAELRLSKNIELLKSRHVTMPMTWGVLRPVVLLPQDADDWSDECSRIVLLHELAHIKRRDCLTQILAQLACALYWFNPLVWSAAKRLRVERELACDDQVLEVGTRATDYATHLVAIASSFESNIFASSMTVGMACSQLESRVVSILNPDIQRRGLNRIRIIAATTLAVVFVVPLSIIQPWVSAAVLSQKATFSKDSKPSTVKPAKDQKELDAYLSKVVEIETQKAIALHIEHQTEVVPIVDHNIEQADLPDPQDAPDESIEATAQDKASPKAAGDTNPAVSSDEQNYRMKLHGITPEFIESARRMGFDNLSVNQLIQMRVHKIDEAFANQVRGWGFADASLNQLVQLRVAGVTAEYLETLKREGFDKLSINRLASLKLQNITPEFINEMRRLGFDKLSPDQLISLKVHNINEVFVKEAENWGYGKLSLNELMQIRVHNVTPNFAREMKALGFNNLSLQKLIQLKIFNITADYLRDMRNLGFDNLTAEQAIQMRQQGITVEYVNKLRAAGFKNVSINQLIDMKRHGIDDILLKNNR